MKKFFNEHPVLATIISGLIVVGFFTVCIMNPEVVGELLMSGIVLVSLPFAL